MDMFDGCEGRRLAHELRWLSEPASWEFVGGRLFVEPLPKTDFFRPCTGDPHDDACLLYARVAGDFTAVTEASAKLAGFGDAAALTVRADSRHWAKICIERSPAGEVSIVSVVTDGLSDDANNEILPAPASHLRLSRLGDSFGMQYSLDGTRWRFVRAFCLDLPKEVMVGIHAQAPFGGGCTASFSRFVVTDAPVKDLRSGE